MIKKLCDIRELVSYRSVSTVLCRRTPWKKYR